MAKGRILSGMRPTGRLHLGNFTGALENWVHLQDSFDCYYMVADWHALTTDLDHSRSIRERTNDMVIDWLAAGIDPTKSPVFVQSHVPEHAELHLIFSMLVSVARLERNPAVKEQARDLGIEATMAYGHLGYPVLQAADILLYKANVVPVGEDQVPHVEITREIARRFNTVFGQVFPEPEARLTPSSRFPGLDGRRMSKSLGNVVLLSDPPEEIQKKIRTAFTDPGKVRRNDPGDPVASGCVVYSWHGRFNPAEQPTILADCQSGVLGCVACKTRLSAVVTDEFAAFRERRAELVAAPDRVLGILEAGRDRAGAMARATMRDVHEAMGF
ncbi:MAG: tryptophanyl-tRNA synthetase [bacterium]|nr:MAG: tryptophanyl-tRNA synthetase [bacterium]